MQRLSTWIAAFAILLAACAPAISQVMAAHETHRAHQAWVEICTMEGSKMIMVDAAHDPQSGHAGLGHLEHCPFCLSHAVQTGMLPDSDFLLPIVIGTHLLPPLYYQASRPLFAWSTAQPRAPPALS